MELTGYQIKELMQIIQQFTDAVYEGLSTEIMFVLVNDLRLLQRAYRIYEECLDILKTKSVDFEVESHKLLLQTKWVPLKMLDSNIIGTLSLSDINKLLILMRD